MRAGLMGFWHGRAVRVAREEGSLYLDLYSAMLAQPRWPELLSGEVHVQHGMEHGSGHGTKFHKPWRGRQPKPWNGVETMHRRLFREALFTSRSTRKATFTPQSTRRTQQQRAGPCKIRPTQHHGTHSRVRV